MSTISQSPELRLNLKYEVVDKDGLHRRPVQDLADLLMSASCKVRINGEEIDTSPGGLNCFALEQTLRGINANLGERLTFELAGQRAAVADLSKNLGKSNFLREIIS